MTSDCPVGFGEIRRRVVKRIAQVAGAALGLIGLQQFFVGDRSNAKQSKTAKKTLASPTQDEYLREELKSLGYVSYEDD
jgi:hypothetical protein